MPEKKRKRRNLEDLGAFEVGDVVISTRIDTETASKLATAAAHAGVPLSKLLRTVLSDYVRPTVSASRPTFLTAGLAWAAASAETTPPSATPEPVEANQRWPIQPQSAGFVSPAATR